MPKSPLVMGILNATPDSFSGDGLSGDLQKALSQAELMVQEGADILDIGGESTRPGAAPVSLQEELDRVLPLIEAIRSGCPVTLSIDTRHFEVAKAAVERGVTIINDVSAGSDPRMFALAREKRCTYLFMHMQGTPDTMQTNPTYPKGVVPEVFELLNQRIKASDLPCEQVWIDPGIGFGKTLEQNLTLLQQINWFHPLADRIVVGTSRKSFLGKILGQADISFEERREGTIASNLYARNQGASVFRVHEVGPMVRALKTWEAISNASQ